MKTANSMAEAVQDLRSRGFINTFNIQDNAIYCLELEREIPAESLTIVDQYHLEGPEADDANTHEVFAVETQDHVMGIMLDTYAQYNAAEFAALFNKVHKNVPGAQS
ncbi:MAG TPA: hypothetical protein VK927_00475 [Adhaeribacter sp.]|nr:hypothetical protein [Adhaeribacter sp.]